MKNKFKCPYVFRMLTVTFGEATLNRSIVYRWYKLFLKSREDANNEERASARLRQQQTKTLYLRKHYNPIAKSLLKDLNKTIGSCHSIFTNLHEMVAAKFVPNLVILGHKHYQGSVVRNDPNLLQSVITGNESWVYG